MIMCWLLKWLISGRILNCYIDAMLLNWKASTWNCSVNYLNVIKGSFQGYILKGSAIARLVNCSACNCWEYMFRPGLEFLL